MGAQFSSVYYSSSLQSAAQLLKEKNKEDFKAKFREQFDEIADDDRIDFPQAQELFEDAGLELIGVSLKAYLCKKGEFDRFDFDGNGTLDFYEAYKCFRYNLLEFQKENGGSPKVKVAKKTPEQAGYQVLKVLGEGGQGQIKLAQGKTGKVALKVYEKSNANAANLDELVGEMEVMKELQKSEHIMHCIEIFQDQEHYYCVNELLEGKDLTCIRVEAPKQGIALTEPYWKLIFKQCVQGLDYMHRHGLMHCDIKEENIMFKTKNYANPQVAIIDFGLSQNSAYDEQSGSGTPGYIPPETIEDDVWYPRGDVFSMGVVFFQLLADYNQLFTDEDEFPQDIDDDDDDEEGIKFLTLNREPPWEKIKQFPAMKPWLSKMLEKKKESRWKPMVLLSQPWFR
eukprot:TRINITY_DN91180_c0_g1_i1.p1 TRINITY_DN91180_c0_g1~~TRINITY_DN91180_c0_g1_i1.p1  ORF type:complete len:421 (-),score=99.99 TRINITY_DN91180_c0_g1_i1:114-1304(-)